MRLTNKQLTAVMRQYGYKYSHCLGVVSGYRNSSHLVETVDGNRYNFIVYKDEPGIAERIKRVNAFSEYIVSHNLPVRCPVDTRVVTLANTHMTRYGGLYTYLDGETIPWEAYTKKHIKLLGMTLGRFHTVSQSYEGLLPLVTDEYLAIVERIRTYFSLPGVRSALRRKLGLEFRAAWCEQFEAVLHESATLTGQISLHMDLVRGNVLFREAREGDALTLDDLALSGILDLEKAAAGHPLFDVARTLAFLLVDCPKPATKIQNYFINSGYRKRGSRTLQSVQLASGDMLEQLVTLFLVYDFYKFLKQNPYESLPENHHFARTCHILSGRQVIQYNR